MNRYQSTFQTWNKVAQQYQDKFMDLDLYNNTYDAFCSLIGNANAEILEIGCGPGNVTRYLLAKRPGFKITGIDVAPAMVELAKTNNPTAEFKEMDCRDIGKISEKFDGIMCGFCLPYLAKEDVAKLIQDSAYLLNDNGIFYLSTIEGNYQQSGYETNSVGDKMYVYYYPEPDLKQQLESQNFEVAHTYRKQYPKGDELSTHLILIARKK